MIKNKIVVLAGFMLLTTSMLSAADEFKAIKAAEKVPDNEKKVYKFAVLPRFSPREILRRFGPLSRLLTRKIGVNIQLVVPSSFANHVSLVRSGQVAFSYQNPVIFAQCMDKLKGIGTAIKNGSDTFRGIIIVRKDSDIRKIDDLRGKRIAIVAPTSAGGFFSQKLSCLMNGINLEKDCKVSIVPGNKQENVILNVYRKKVDAGFIRESALHRVDSEIDPSQILVIAKTVPLPNWTFAANKEVPEHIVKRVTRILLSLGADSPVLKAAKLDGFMRTDPSKFEGLRQLLSK